jgi:hypothetical protein
MVPAPYSGSRKVNSFRLLSRLVGSPFRAVRLQQGNHMLDKPSALAETVDGMVVRNNRRRFVLRAQIPLPPQILGRMLDM